MTTFQEWLESEDKFPCVLVNANALVNGIETTFYFSSKSYPNYLSILNSQSINISESLSLNGESAFSIGDVELFNNDGSIDEYLNYVWASRSIQIYYGDVRWNFIDFQLIFDGVIDDIDSRDKNSINFRISDKLSRLNNPITENVLGGNTQNKDSLIPLTFGEVFNITPLLIDPPNLKYQVHQSKIESVIEVRDAGVPVGFVANVNAGTFTLNASPFYAITCSVQGDKPTVYNNDVANIIKNIVTTYGEANTRFTLSDIDTTNFNDFANTNSQAVGIFIDSSETILNICNSLASSVGAQMVTSREGKLQLKKIDLTPINQIEITNNDIVLNSFSLKEKIKVQGSFKIGYAKNYTIQENLDTRIPTNHKEILAKEWYETNSSNSTIKTQYKQLNEVERINTLLLIENDADSLADYYLNLYGTPRFIYSLSVAPKFMNANLGSSVKITTNRYGMESGKNGQLIGKTTNFGNQTIQLEVLI